MHSVGADQNHGQPGTFSSGIAYPHRIAVLNTIRATFPDCTPTRAVFLSARNIDECLLTGTDSKSTASRVVYHIISGTQLSHRHTLADAQENLRSGHWALWWGCCCCWLPWQIHGVLGVWGCGIRADASLSEPHPLLVLRWGPPRTFV